MQYIWLIPLLPGIGAAINGLVGIRSFSRKTAGVVACATMAAALGLSLVAFWQLLGAARRGARATTSSSRSGFRRFRCRLRNGASAASRCPGASGSIRCRG